MIFFMTVIKPPSHISEKLKDLQDTLFEHRQIMPAPFPLICHSLSDKKIARLSRSQIADIYPYSIVTDGYLIIDNHLYLKIPSSDVKLTEKKPIGILLGKITNRQTPIEEYIQVENIQFKNYSLALYEISSLEKEDFLMNMSWIKLWEVPRKKTDC